LGSKNRDKKKPLCLETPRIPEFARFGRQLNSKHTINKNMLFLWYIYYMYCWKISNKHRNYLITETAECHEQSDEQSPRHYKL